MRGNLKNGSPRNGSSSFVLIKYSFPFFGDLSLPTPSGPDEAVSHRPCPSLGFTGEYADQSTCIIILTIADNTEGGKWPKKANWDCQKLALHSPTECVHSVVMSLLVWIHGAMDSSLWGEFLLLVPSQGSYILRAFLSGPCANQSIVKVPGQQRLLWFVETRPPAILRDLLSWGWTNPPEDRVAQKQTHQDKREIWDW